MKRSLSLTGIPVSPGIAVGRAVVCIGRSDSTPRRDLDADEVPAELERLRLAVESAIREIGDMAGQVETRLGKEYAAIFQAHALFLRDPSFLGPIEKKVRLEKVNAEWAVEVVADALAARLRDLPDKDLALRASDLDDIATILKRGLGEGSGAVDRLATLPWDSCVLVADELTPSDAVRIPRDKVVAFVTERGGKTSHAAILARSFGLPAVVAVPKLLASVGEGDRVIVDGREGVLWREPSEDVLTLFRERQGRDATRELSLKERSLSGTATTRDGVEVAIRANIELAREVPDVFEYGADGVGLFRSEFLYLSSAGVEFPDEATQAAIYRQVVSRLAPRPVVIRTYDLGGKKGARHLSGAEENPVLGLRGVRLCFSHPEMFRTQLRALLSVASGGDLRILVPMVAGVEEVRRVRAFVEEARQELVERGIDVPDSVPIGAMIEVPSAAVTADLIAPEVDFLSLGTNDLIQYTLAADRANEAVSEIYRPQHPAILRLIARVQDAARAAGKPLAICGEMAADPALFLLLLGLGIREFSMGPRSVPLLKDIARCASAADAARMARAALSLSTPDDVSALLAREAEALLSGDPETRAAVNV
ncbi:MAG TPA: phosphoenolpyruvate--protein phosphotransferase [Thermoanaerobaculia bacterium]|jgi:phosphotransferase system enzyme I (PtsI)|nr:phosphoenolpyruvate--protein phosphotransferase [Thermoanaerobaculia bacterium]HPA50450.1 phosphoenolpyruvate--protein phosphotransferase [Thermoanaerobaculia bacterium]HQN08073.1 phosphoenolpyruvate--protein phosphotransferase [Thermoanaerobaculia bacterium]HQP86542.1 phosphoenolpyruvate--protein phosphotransferase [Thermoanaerobaculia bacterium]